MYLHLLRQHRATPRPFSSLLFFERRPQASVMHRRLKYYALLAARLALLILLVLAFAQPFFNQAVPVSSGKRLLVIAIDRSFSMRAHGHFSQAQAAAQRSLDSASSALPVTVLAVDSLVETLAAPPIGKKPAHAAIASATSVDRASSFGEFARSLRVLAQNTGMQLDVHFFSDLQATSVPPSFADIDPGPQASLTLHSVAESREPNWAVESVTAPARVYKEHARVAAVIKGWQTEAAARKVSLFLDGRQVASQQATVPANGRAPVEFLGIQIAYGAHRGEVRIEPHDDLPEDDAFPFSIERADPAPVLFLSSGRTRDAFYYQSALEAANAGFTVQTSNVQASTWSQASAADFSRFAFIAIADDGELTSPMETQLSAYVRRGGSLFVLAGAGTLLHSRVAVSGMAAHPSDHSVTGARPDAQQPAVADLSLEGVQFYRWLQLSLSPNARVLARLSDGSPLVVEEPQGEGLILTFASSFDNLANDFPPLRLRPLRRANRSLSRAFRGRRFEPGGRLSGGTAQGEGFRRRCRRDWSRRRSSSFVPRSHHRVDLLSTPRRLLRSAARRRPAGPCRRPRRSPRIGSCPHSRRNPVIMAEYGAIARPGCRGSRRGRQSRDSPLQSVARRAHFCSRSRVR